ncbi:type IV secretion system protein [Dongshaea marina]|uniref:type IV secretion system protein n=1 Tax=Dongshaea marina TaxID=2047966 RepID=UPI000D3E443F|nr:type IV secretion system protein [Dongshaea marina]
MDQFTVFQFLGESTEGLINHYIVSGTANLIHGIAPFFLIAVTIYIMVQGYLLMMGKTNDFASDFLIRCVMIIVISTMALNTDNYTYYIIDTTKAWGSELASLMFPSNNPGQSQSIYAVLDSLVKTMTDQVIFTFQQVSGWKASTWPWIFTAATLLLSFIPLTIASALIIIGVQFLMALLLTVGPLFLAFAMFPVTRRFFDSWINKVFEYSLQMVLGVTVISMAIHGFKVYLNYNDIQSAGVNPGAIGIKVLIVGVVLIYVVKQVPQLAGSLAGGFGTAAMTLKDTYLQKPTKILGKGLAKAAGKGIKGAWSQVGGSGGRTAIEGSKKSSSNLNKIVKDKIKEQHR